jgi:hypothetical protein
MKRPPPPPIPPLPTYLVHDKAEKTDAEGQAHLKDDELTPAKDNIDALIIRQDKFHDRYHWLLVFKAGLY